MAKFKDIEIGQRFYAWGDQDLNYNHPKYCCMEKNSHQSAVEILMENKQEQRGVCVLMENDAQYLTQNELFKRWDKVIIS